MSKTRSSRKQSATATAGDTPTQSLSAQDTTALRGPGRPPGQPNRSYDRGERRPGQCRKCKSTEATTQKKTIRRLPQDPDYTHVELIRCRCRRCGQWRIDRQPVNVD